MNSLTYRPRLKENLWSKFRFGPKIWKSRHNLESAPKFTADPRSTVFSKSTNPFNLPQKSKIRALFKAKSVDPKTYSPPSWSGCSAGKSNGTFLSSVFFYVGKKRNRLSFCGCQRNVSVNYLFGRPLIPSDFIKRIATSNFRDMRNLQWRFGYRKKVSYHFRKVDST